MQAPTTRTFTPARIVALALVALAVPVSPTSVSRPAPDPVSVPAGAQAGDLTLEPCEYATEHGSYAADCGTLVVPENRHDSGSRLIALPVTRIRAQHRAPGRADLPAGGRARHHEHGVRQGEPVRRSTATSCSSAIAASTARRARLPRGRRRRSSTRPTCSARSPSRLRRGLGAARAGSATTASTSPTTGSSQQVDDLEAARRALGYDRVDLLSESAGHAHGA